LTEKTESYLMAVTL